MPFSNYYWIKKMEKKLQGNWVLTSVDLQLLNKSTYFTVKFDTKKKIISGTDGCMLPKFI